MILSRLKKEYWADIHRTFIYKDQKVERDTDSCPLGLIETYVFITTPLANIHVTDRKAYRMSLCFLVLSLSIILRGVEDKPYYYQYIPNADEIRYCKGAEVRH